ncbi:MAG TPA: site-2 protease family protein [Candidatus Onthomonas avicola]|nr:site-2 protease family protein [Candidatus Onthomonas avicola]
MSFLQHLGSVFDLGLALALLVRVLAALICLTVHELCHGLAARWLGDPTAEDMGRLSLNPLHHIDLFGLVLLLTAGFGWAKPVPVNPGYFKNPKRGMAITALAGPASNFVMAVLSAGVLQGMYRAELWQSQAGTWAMAFAAALLWLNLGLGIFNLFPIPPLDGSKVFFSLFPDRIYFWVLRHERYIMLALFLLVFFGVLDGPLNALLQLALSGICRLTGLPVEVFWTLIVGLYA